MNPEPLNLHSTEPVARLTAAREFNVTQPGAEVKWPFGYWGSANAWLVLLGPSPGADKKAPRDATTDPWHGAKMVGYGDRAEEVRIRDHPEHRARAWAEVQRAAFAGAGLVGPELEDCRLHLTSVMNAGFENAASAGNTESAQQRRIAGCAEFLFPALEQAKPAVIVVLSKAAWDPFYAAVHDSGRIERELQPLETEPIARHRKAVRRLFIRISPHVPFATAVVLSPVHPSMAFSVQNDGSAIRQAVWSMLQQPRGTFH